MSSIVPGHKDMQKFSLEAAEWKSFLRAEDEELCREMRIKTGRGLGVGTEKFIGQIENKLQRSLACKPQGRPREETQ
jgi:hypothetical protein